MAGRLQNTYTITELIDNNKFKFEPIMRRHRYVLCVWVCVCVSVASDRNCGMPEAFAVSVV